MNVRVARAGSLILGLAVLMMPGSSFARDVFVVRVLTPFGACPATGWRDHLIFYNRTAADQQISPLAASNGYQIPSGQVLLIPAGETRTVVQPINVFGGVTNQWAPPSFGGVLLLVNKLDVPPGVLVESRIEIYGVGGAELPCPSSGSIGSEVVGHFASPVVESLVPPNSPHFHLGSDLGTLTSRTNVGIYNAEETAGAATIEIRAACGDRLLESRQVPVPGNTLVYVQGFRNRFLDGVCSGGGAAYHSRYVVVTMDRAGFSFVATRAENLTPRVTVGSTTAR